SPFSFLLWSRCPPPRTLSPYTTRFRSIQPAIELGGGDAAVPCAVRLDDGLHQLVEATARLTRYRHGADAARLRQQPLGLFAQLGDRKSTRLNSSHVKISYAVFCLKKTK